MSELCTSCGWDKCLTRFEDKHDGEGLVGDLVAGSMFVCEVGG